jgi:hypothetical protein
MLAAFGMTDDPAPDMFLIALAALNLVADSADRMPLVLVAEDAHWLDRSTAVRTSGGSDPASGIPARRV